MGRNVVSRQVLRHNPQNAVTSIVERVTQANGGTLVHKRLQAPVSATDSNHAWAASHDRRHWNYWRREAVAYGQDVLRASLADTGLGMPGAEVEEHDGSVDLWLEDVAGTPGTEFDLADHAAVAAGLGRWQAAGPLATSWTSEGFLRAYGTSKVVPWQVLDDDAAWRHTLIRRTWPGGLRAGWARLIAHRERLLAVMEHLPRTRSHLDAWVANQKRRPDGEVVLLDWAFFGDGALGEDLGNHVPDAVFDLFWPAEGLAALDAACFEAYLSGLRESGWHGDERHVRLGVVASCVKYTWLLPQVLARASEPQHFAYHQVADTEHLYHQRGLAFAHLVAWCDEALYLMVRQ
jgi:hypothetical protein